MTWGQTTGRTCALFASALATLALVAAPASAATLFVDAANGSDAANTCQAQGSPCKTIGQAVTQAAGGDTIEIAAGTYDEGISTSTDLNFVGAGATGSDRTLIDSTGLAVPALELTGGGSLRDLALNTDDDSIGGALHAAGGTVTAQHIAVTTAASDTATNAFGHPGGSDAISVASGTTFNLSDSTASAVNTDADVQNVASCTFVVQDGSGVEVGGGTTTITGSTISAVRGIALRVHQPNGSTTNATTVRDSVIESSGTEDVSSSTCDGWQDIEAAAPAPLNLTGDTVYNDTVPSAGHGQPPADALTVEQLTGVSVVAHNTIFLARAAGTGGADIDVIGEAATVDHSSYTTTSTSSGGTITPLDTASNIAGDPQLVDPSNGEFGLAAGSPLIGSADPSVLSNGETDVTGTPRAATCPGGLSILNLGAVESPAPPCPGTAPAPAPGSATYAYAPAGSNAYEQLSLGTGDLLTRLSPFETAAVSANGSGGLLAGSASAQVYAFEQESGHTVIQQYGIGTSGQLAPGTSIAPPSGSSIESAALTPDGRDMYVAVSGGGGVAVDHDRVSSDGTPTAAGATQLPPGVSGISLAVDDNGRVYALCGNGDGTSTLRVYRANADGTLSQDDSLAIAATGGLVVAPNGSEAVVVTGNTNFNAGQSNGAVHPVAISLTGALAAPSTTSVPSSGASGNSLNFPMGLAFSPDSSTLYVADEGQVGTGGGINIFGSLVAPFAVGGDGSLTADHPNPTDTAGAVYDAGLAVTPDGAGLLVPDDSGAPATGAVDQFALAAAGTLTARSPAQVTTDTDQRALILVSPPGGSTTAGGGGGTTTLGAPSPGGGGGGSASPPGIAGGITDATTHAPVSGAAVSVCPQGRLLTSSCVNTTSNESGRYSVAVGPGTYLVEVSPPTSGLFAASVFATVQSGGLTTQDFALRAPRELSGGVSFDTPGGKVDSGVPTVNWSTPFSFTVPLSAPTRQPANTTLLVSHVVGISSDTSSKQGSAFNQAGVVLYAMHYGAGGTATGMSAPVVGVASCDSGCSDFANPGSGPPYGSPGVVLAPGPNGSTLLSTQTPDGTEVVLRMTSYQTPPLASGPNPFANVGVDLTGAGNASAATAASSPTTPNPVQQIINQLANQLSSQPNQNSTAASSAAVGNSAGADFASVVTNVGQGTHGGGSYYDAETHGVQGPQSPTGQANGDTAYYPDAPQASPAAQLAAADEAGLSAAAQTLGAPANGALGAQAGAGLGLQVSGGGGAAGGQVGAQFEQALQNSAAGSGPLNQNQPAGATPNPSAVAQMNAALDQAAANAAAVNAMNNAVDNAVANALGAANAQPGAQSGGLSPSDFATLVAWLGNFYIDPSGVVQTTRRIPLAGAKVTLSRSSTPHGHQTTVANGSTIMSPGNRRNPGLTDVLGQFAWDTAPGYYAIAAAHAGCRAARTSVFSVPPPRSNLSLTLRCGAIHRSATSIALKPAAGSHGTVAVRATVTARGGGALLGTLTFRLRGGRPVAVAVDAHGHALVDLFLAAKSEHLTATYSGNGLYAPSSAQRRLSR
jgi:hypothetical protein